MTTNKLSLIDRIADAQQRITDLLLHQCEYGAQTKLLPPEFAACGQFVGGDAEAIQQYGLHGISAALRVLGACQSDECRRIVKRLVSFCEASFGVNHAYVVRPKFTGMGDSQNVIKLGELLYGLSFVTTAQADRGPLVQHIADRLKTCIVDDRGWGYFLDETEVELLPTAYAVRGLAQNGFNSDIRGVRKSLLESLAARAHSSDTSAVDVTTAVACTYCLTFCLGADSEDSVLEDTFLSTWRSLEPLLSEDIEQNVEYWRGKVTHYLRIPFQLYLLALASKYSQRRLAGFRAQRRLNSIIDALRSTSFKYPYSGAYLSSRTNGIAYDALAAIRERARNVVYLHLAYGADYVRGLAGSRPVRVIAAILAGLVICYSIRQWALTGKLADLAPELLAGFVTLILAWARR